MNEPTSSGTAFDGYAADYDAALAEGLSVFGEDKFYFARGRVAWLAGCLQSLNLRAKSVMDFGCGTGTAVPILLEMLAADSVLGTDISTKSLELARNSCRLMRAKFSSFDQWQPDGQIDLTYCDGVLHHIPLEHRLSALDYVYRALKPGGLFALWENNPWNPGTRYVMSRIPFDRDAITLTPPEAQGLLQAAGFEILRTDFLFIFPRALRWLRSIESLVSRWPLGAQYQILCCKPLQDQKGQLREMNQPDANGP